MRPETFDILKPLADKWEEFKQNNASTFSTEQLHAVKSAHQDLFGWSPSNLWCRSCADEMIKRVFTEYERESNKS